MTDVIERAEAVLQHRDTRIGHGLVRDLVGELQVTRALLDATRSQLSTSIADFCALRDALPREEVWRILGQIPT